MNRDDLSEAQMDGRACVFCGREDTPMRPVFEIDGTQVFACTPTCPTEPDGAR
jgi:hypothetical protein